MKKRQIKLIELLLNSNIEFCRGVELANLLNVSKKTIQNDIKEINSHHILIKSRRGSGYYLINKQDTINYIETIKYSENKDINILKTLLLNEVYPFYQLADNFFISESTLTNIIKEINNKFKEESFQIIIKRKNNFLICLGKSLEKKKALQKSLLKEVLENNLDIRILNKYFSNLNIIELQKVILKYKQSRNQLILDYELIEIVVQIALVLVNNNVGNFPINKNILSPTEVCLLSKIERTQSIHLTCHSQKEIIEIIRRTQSQQKLNKYYSIAVFALNELAKNISDTYRINILQDQDSVNKITNQLVQLITRTYNNQFLVNPLLIGIKRNHPLIYDISTFIINFIEKIIRIRIPEDEIANITMVLFSELKKINNDNIVIMIVGTYSTIIPTYFMEIIREKNNNVIFKIANKFDYKDQWNNKIDGILSFIRINLPVNIPCLYINSGMTSIYWNGIFDFINNIQYKHSLATVEFSHYFSQGFFYSKCSFCDKKQLLTFMCQKLEKQKIVQSNFFDCIWKNEEKLPTSFGKYLAIPHLIENTATQDIISVAILQKPIQWDSNNKVQFVFLLALSLQCSEKSSLYKYILNICDNLQNRQLLAKVTSFPEFKQILLKNR